MNAHPILELRHVTKSFGPTIALSDMSLSLYAGEVHAIVGENGAGKSTIIKIMTGIHQPSSGELIVDAQVTQFRNSQDARRHGVTAIFQEPMVFPDMDVAENIFISSTEEKPWLNWRSMYERAAELISRVGVTLDPRRAANSLSVAEQQTVEIARALSQDVRVLIMDEPTAALSAKEADELLAVAKKLAQSGVAVVYISHRLEEVFAIADRVSVIRDGAHISTRPIAEVTSAQLIADMVGRSVGNYHQYIPNTPSEREVLSIDNLGRAGVFENVTFNIHQGEIVALAGLVGARRTDIALAIFGIDRATAGEIIFEGASFHPKSPQDAMQRGVAYVTEDRRKYGLALSKPIFSNITLATLRNFANAIGILDTARERETAKHFKTVLNIRTPNVEMEVGNLSGGNQQKVMLAKWLETGPKLLIVDEPTRGIDISAKAEVHELLRNFTKDGGAVLVISSDLPEVLALGDRIVVMREGKQMATLENKDATQERIIAFATGADKEVTV